MKIIFPEWSGPDGVAALESFSEVPGIELQISRMPDLGGRNIPCGRVEHCKFAVAEGERAWVGTSHWEPGHFSSLSNIAVTLDNRRLAGRVRCSFETSWTEPHVLALNTGTSLTSRAHDEMAPSRMKVYGE